MADDIPLILFAEDDDEDWILISDVLDNECRAKVRYERVKDGEALLARLRDPALPTPHLVMLDLKMPRKDGTEALKEIRADTNLRHIPVIILTTSKLDADIFGAYYVGANSYLVKPVRFPDMAKVLKAAHHYWTEIATVPLPRCH